MKSMKGLSMNKMLGSIKKKTGGNPSEIPSSSAAASASATDSPEETAAKSVKAFCQSGGSNVTGDEVLFLPPIVDAAESSPTAAAECARVIRKFISKEYASRPSWQYNAIMLVRILTDNPGATFTRNLDQKFVDTAKLLLKNGKDNRVRQILMETLDDFEQNRGYDEHLHLMVEMWKKEKDKALAQHGGRMPPMPPRPMPNNLPYHPQSQSYFSRSHSNKRLPDPVELASRLEEARTSAKLLEQVVMNTPPSEMLNNDLIKEFADRCLSASRSIQGYMVSDNPTPDNDTMESLIDTNEQLQTALNQHQRSVLNAKKQLGLGERSENPSPAPEANGMAPGMAPGMASGSGSGTATPVLPPIGAVGNGKGRHMDMYAPPPGPPPGIGGSRLGAGSFTGQQEEQTERGEDPFADPFGDAQRHSNDDRRFSADEQGNQRHAEEPFHPGFAGREGNAAGKQAQVMQSAGLTNSAGTPPTGRYNNDQVSDDDLYEASPRDKQPMHRY